MLTWHAACGQGNGWADRTMYGGEEPGSSPPASHPSAPRAYMPPDSSMSEGTYSTQPGALSARGTAPSMLQHVKKSHMSRKVAQLCWRASGWLLSIPCCSFDAPTECGMVFTGQLVIDTLDDTLVGLECNSLCVLSWAI